MDVDAAPDSDTMHILFRFELKVEQFSLAPLELQRGKSHRIACGHPSQLKHITTAIFSVRALGPQAMNYACHVAQKRCPRTLDTHTRSAPTHGADAQRKI